GPVALRTVREVVGGERFALALQHRGNGRDQLIDRNAVGIVVAADKAVFGEAREARGRGRQPGRQQRGVVEGGRGHGRNLPLIFLLRKQVAFASPWLLSVLARGPDRSALGDEGIMP